MELRVSAKQFADYMEYRGETVRSLAAKVGCNRSTIGHLRSGTRRSVRGGRLARKIEEALDAPKGSLFMGRLSRVARNGEAA